MEKTYAVTFTQGYIASPYWPAVNQVVDITKKSGVNRARSEQNRAKALDAYLRGQGMTLEQFRALEAKAKEPFYRARNLFPAERGEGHADDEICIPPHHLYGAMAECSDTAPSAVRIAKRAQIRAVVKVSPIWTGKTAADGVWERFVAPTAGGGQKLSNQRALRSDPYIGPFTSRLTVSFDPQFVEPARLTRFLDYLGREVGVGASRKMAWGRFTVIED